MNAAVSLPLPMVKVSNQQLYNCVQFIDQSYMWGPVATADVYLGGTALGQCAKHGIVPVAGNGVPCPGQRQVLFSKLTGKRVITQGRQ